MMLRPVSISASLLALAICASAPAHAEGLIAGVDLRLLPAGTLESGSEGVVTESIDTAPTFGFTGHLDYAISPYLLLGVMPQLTFGIKGADDAEDEDAATQLDLMVRVAAGFNASPALKLFAYVAPGFSIIAMPEPWRYDDPSGLVIALGAGAMYDVGRRMYLSLDLGYQAGFQGIETNGRDIDVSSNFLTLGLGLGFRL